MIYGDVSAEDKELAKELLGMEKTIEKEASVYSKPVLAKMLVCLSHDWFVIGDEDKGSELLEKASEVCPGYFDNEIKEDIAKDPMFSYLVESLTSHILIVAKSILGSKK